MEPAQRGAGNDGRNNPNGITLFLTILGSNLGIRQENAG